MERRREPRIRIDQPIRLTVLDGNASDVPAGTPAKTLDASGKGMRILLDRPIVAGTAVKIETGDSLILGEVCYSFPHLTGFAVGIEVDQVLSGLGELNQIHSRLLGGTWQPSTHRPVEALAESPSREHQQESGSGNQDRQVNDPRRARF